MLLLAALAAACQEPELVVGAWSCPAPPRVAEDGGELESFTGPVEMPWSTDFEHELCDLNLAQGYCYAHTDASYEFVSTFARSGTKSVAFTIDTEPMNRPDTRCVREGVLPEDAIYGAWYYLPEQHDAPDNWNLLHFQGGSELHNLWDVIVASDEASGRLKLWVRGYVPRLVPLMQDDPPTFVPIGVWFHIEFRLKRASDATGQVTLYQDGKVIVDQPGIVTDDSSWGQWYVGNLAYSLAPSKSTLYVDDISIRPAP